MEQLRDKLIDIIEQLKPFPGFLIAFLSQVLYERKSGA